MKRILILGAGTAGTMMANHLRRALEPEEWEILVIDQDNQHLYQPGLLFIPFGHYTRRDLFKPRSRFIPPGVDLVVGAVDAIDPEHSQVRLHDGTEFGYDFLVIATGSRISPADTEGLLGEGWRKNVFDFYTVDGATALARALREFRGGRLVVNPVEMPIKCPVAPLEFAFLADAYFHEQGIRNDVEIVYATPLSGAFTRPRASAALGDLLQSRGIRVEAEFNAGSVDGARRVLSSWDGRELDYDLLVSIPTNRGAEVIARSEMGNELDFIPTGRQTLRSDGWENVWVIGDATDLPSSKAGSVAHFQSEVLTRNLLRAIAGREPAPAWDGHANCFVETGGGKAVLIDFNYDVEPLPGRFPLPGVGPLTLLEESEMNHWGKLAFRSVYWNLLLKGADLSAIGPEMATAGKWS